MLLETIHISAFIASVSIFNRLRGSGQVSKYVPLLFLTLPFYIYTQNITIALVTVVGMVLWASTGWKRGLLAIHGWSYVYWNNEGYKTIIDTCTRMVYRVCGKDTPSKEHENGRDTYRLYGMVWMSIRALLLVPGFVALGSLSDSLITSTIVGTLTALMMGPVYYASGIRHVKASHGIAEFVYGTIIGAGIVLQYNL